MASGQEQEFTVRVPPRNKQKSFHIMKFRSSTKNTDPAQWSQVRMVRENNKKEYKTNEDEQPKFGAGSEFGREEREEARRKKYGYSRKKYDPDLQPWLMRIGGKRDGKHYRGQREGGVSDNTTFYVFTHAPDGSFEAYPIKEWYNFVPRVAYRTLDADEAEEKYAQRGKILNHWAVMLNKKLKPDQGDDDDDVDDDENRKKGKKGGKKASEKEFKITDMDDDWAGGSGDELDSDTDEEDSGKKKKKNNESDDEDSSKKKSKKKKSKNEADDEAFEDSDDGEDEGREVDYMSDESSEEEDIEADKHDIKGVDQDEGLAKMLDSDESEEEDANKKEDDPEDEQGEKKGKKDETDAASRGNSPPKEQTSEKSQKAEKRKAIVDRLLDPNAENAPKRGRFEAGSSGTQPATSSIEANFEEDVRRYLARKPMTTTEILRKMTQKKTGLPKEELMPLLVNVLKRINPHKQKVKGTMYLSLKSGK